MPDQHTVGFNDSIGPGRLPAVLKYYYIAVQPEPLLPGRTTCVWRVINNHGGFCIGEIRWYGAWRQYCFFPNEDTVWSAGCLRDVKDALAKIDLARKVERGYAPQKEE